MINEILTDAFIDTARMLPLLLAIYIAIELFEFKFGSSIRKGVQAAGSAGPAIGALAGAFPQCGFSVIATALYTQRMATIGTLLAVYLSTSDEALPILLSDPAGTSMVLPLIITKILIGMGAGYAIDLALREQNREVLEHIAAAKNGRDSDEHHHETVANEAGCCGHAADATSKKFDPKELILHPVIHTVKIFVFLFAVSAVLGFLMEYVGRESLAEILAAGQGLQPIAAALVGLIPNCAASVALTELYLAGAITYGAALAGLCASGGLGLLVLAREESNKKNVFLVVALLFVISVLAGYGTQLLF